MILSPEEQVKKTKNWPKDTGETMQEQNARIQRETIGLSNLAPGYTQERIDHEK